MAATPKNVSSKSLRHVSLAERQARLGRRHLLAPGTASNDVRSIADAVVALHATDPATVFLSVTTRLRQPSLAVVEHALLVDRSIVRHHAMRRTMWVMEPHVARAAHASCTTALATKEWARMAKMLADNGIEKPEAWVASAKVRAREAIAGLGEFTARQLGVAAPELNVPLRLSEGKSYEGVQGAHTRLVQNLGFDGEIIRTHGTGSWVSGEFVWAQAKDWVEGGLRNPELGVRDATRILVDAYFRSFGPVTTQDIQWWGKWTGAQTSQALADVGAVPVSVDAGESTESREAAWLHPDDTGVESTPDSWATLLPSLDPTVMGWKDRAWYTGVHGDFGKTLFDRNGNAGNSVMSNGRVIGTYAHQKDRSVVVHYFDAPTKKVRSMVNESVERYLATVGDTVVRPRYPAPVQATLTPN